MTNPNPVADMQTLSAGLTAMVDKFAAHIVGVRSDKAQSSGFIWKSGIIVTADEALAEKGDVTVTLPGGETAKAVIAGRDPTTDIALLRIDRQDHPAVSMSAAPISAGMLTLTLGAEAGAPIAALGIVARSGGAWRSFRGGDIDARIELDTRLRGNAEGGAVLDMSGGTIGMAVFGPRRRTLVIPAATIERVASQLEAHGRIPRGYLGLGLHPVSVNDSQDIAAMVMTVDPKGPGVSAGIQQGDLILSWDGQPLPSIEALLHKLGPDSVGKTVNLELRRGGQSQSTALTITERPAA